MKIKGQTISAPNVAILAIPRQNGEDIIFKARAILSMDTFDKLCPEPEPPTIKYPDGRTVPDFKDKNYKKRIDELGELRMAYMFIESLRATEDLTWDTVNYDDPSTWLNYKKELQDAGFNHIEVQRLQGLVFEANALDETKFKEARERFILSQALTSQQ